MISKRYWRPRKPFSPAAALTDAYVLALLLTGFLAPYPTVEFGWLTLAGFLFLKPSYITWALHRPTLILALFYGILTTFWTDLSRDLESSLVRLADIWLGLCLARNMESRRLLNLIGWSLLIALTFHLFAVLRPLEIAFDSHGAWRGLTPHKNALGLDAALGLLVSLLAGSENLHWATRLVLGGLGLTLLLGSTSVAPLLALLISLSLAGSVQKLGGIRALLFVCTTGLMTLPVYWETILAFFQREPYLSGRAFLWMGALRQCSDRLAFGHGHAQPELVGFPESFHTHNGVLNLVMTLGVLGASLFLLDLSLVIIRAARQPLNSNQRFFAFILLFLGVISLVEVTPSHGAHSSYLILYAVATQRLLLPERLNE